MTKAQGVCLSKKNGDDSYRPLELEELGCRVVRGTHFFPSVDPGLPSNHTLFAALGRRVFCRSRLVSQAVEAEEDVPD